MLSFSALYVNWVKRYLSQYRSSMELNTNTSSKAKYIA